MSHLERESGFLVPFTTLFATIAPHFDLLWWTKKNKNFKFKFTMIFRLATIFTTLYWCSIVGVSWWNGAQRFPLLLRHAPTPKLRDYLRRRRWLQLAPPPSSGFRLTTTALQVPFSMHAGIGSAACEIHVAKIGFIDCKWYNVNAPGSYTPWSHSLMGALFSVCRKRECCMWLVDKVEI